MLFLYITFPAAVAVVWGMLEIVAVVRVEDWKDVKTSNVTVFSLLFSLYSPTFEGWRLVPVCLC